MVEDVALAVKRNCRADTPVYCLPYVFEMVQPKRVVEDFAKIKQGEWKEAY